MDSRRLFLWVVAVLGGSVMLGHAALDVDNGSGATPSVGSAEGVYTEV